MENQMSAPSFEYSDSISINALTLLSLNIRNFNYQRKGLHTIGLKLSDEIISVVAPYTVPIENHTITTTLTYNSNKYKDATDKLSNIRLQIKKAINEGLLIIDELDTKDCHEIRINYESANKWLRTSQIASPDIRSTDWRQDKKDNILLVIASLLDNEKSNAAIAREIADDLNTKSIVRDTQAIEKLLAEAKEKLKTSLQKGS
jgi:hypothetical protein